MNYVLRSIFETSIIVICATLVAAQSIEPKHKLPVNSERPELSQQASLEETLKWLERQISTHAFYKIKITNSRNTAYKVAAIRFEGCIITVKEIITDTSKAGKILSTHTTKSRVNLAYLDYMRVVLDRGAVKSFGNYTVHAYTRGNRYVVQFHYEFRSRRLTTRENKPMAEIAFVFTDEEIAKQVVSALSHAIRLCQTQQKS